MDCSNFVIRYTDYKDGSASAEVIGSMQEHLSVCESCRRYEAVVECGSSLLRSLPRPELREDFQPRLQHRLYNLQEKRFVSNLPTSRVPTFAVVGTTLLYSAVMRTNQGIAPSVSSLGVKMGNVGYPFA